MEFVDKKYAILMGIFIASLTSANYLAAKITVLGTIGDITLLVPAGVVAYAVTFTITDIISEVYGRKIASMTVLVGFVTQFFIILYSFIALLLPIASFQMEYSNVFDKVFGVAPNIVIASLTAYLISQNHDVWAFHWWKKKTNGKYLWLRNNASTAVSQLIDTVIFITLAFGVLPLITGGIGVSWNLIPYMIIGQCIVKIIIAVFDTPFVYLGVMLVKGRMKLITCWRGKNARGI